mmetsp:Transcript_129455/g.413786  ORF Transcript_129455/g.413786 Transcript_129455/m.413786 type:complete len:163 (-) Transcript_129455:54-542(-)
MRSSRTGAYTPRRHGHVDRHRSRPRPSSYRGTAHRGHYQHDQIDTCCNFGLSFSSVTPRAMTGWVVLQVVSLIFQLLLWQEARAHLALYEQTLSEHCAAEHRIHGVCIGPTWNLSSWHTFALNGGAGRLPYGCGHEWRNGRHFGRRANFHAGAHSTDRRTQQ